MSSARKLQRRMAQRPDVMGNLQKALEAVEHIKGIQPDIRAIGELSQLLEATKGLVETMAYNFEVEQEVMLRLFERQIQGTLEQHNFRDEVAKIRQEVLASRPEVS